MRRKPLRGLTLLEALLTMFLFALALVVVSKLVTGSQHLIRHSSGRSQALRTCQWALSELRQQVEASARVDEPTTGSSNRLVLTTFRRNNTRLPTTLPRWRAGTDPWWDPYAAGDLESLQFSLNSDQLMKLSGGTSTLLAGDIDNFWVNAKEQQLEIEVTVREQIRNSRFVTRVRTP